MSDDTAKKPDDRNEDQPDIEEVITDFDNGIRVRSGFEIEEQEPGVVGINIFGPLFEFTVEDDELDDETNDEDES